MTNRCDLYSFENLWRQYRICRRNKRNTINQLRFEVNAEAQLLTLQQELRAHTYQPGPSICFVTDGPKPREVFAADFRDRLADYRNQPNAGRPWCDVRDELLRDLAERKRRSGT